MGFEPQIREIVQQFDMPGPEAGRMTCMFSATFPREIQKLAQAFMRNYIWVGVGRVGGASDTVEQKFVLANAHEKAEKTLQVLKENPTDTTLIFVGMKKTAAALHSALVQAGARAVPIHGDMLQPAREASLAQFRSGQAKVLVATDVAARGLDIPSVSHVINYDLPTNVEDYVHRIGRTGRIGRKGWSTSLFATHGQGSNIQLLKGLIGILTDSKQKVPAFMQELAAQNGIRAPAQGWGGGGSFGGSDARGGQKLSSSISGAGDGKACGGKGNGFKKVCPRFMMGHCKWGAECYDSHDLDEGPWGPQQGAYGGKGGPAGDSFGDWNVEEQEEEPAPKEDEKVPFVLPPPFIGRGSSVKIHGLTSEAGSKLNGLIGKCLRFQDASDRWVVGLPDGVEKALKESNLTAVKSESSVRASDARFVAAMRSKASDDLTKAEFAANAYPLARPEAPKVSPAVASFMQATKEKEAAEAAKAAAEAAKRPAEGVPEAAAKVPKYTLID
eukprot:gnl/TRDRNA2_/TRDRNA2_92177_c2_seq1.p1 gnl/TRDRNA2_/TRDRNA2_92177_c2~~gnl/TRDRNA2_/TRDRNA2_92177_c2_seq1.p1  ORF type:complete len:535 (-),score=109.67 gnl/TRDRNA2_/TRDRNA2_92177_c2_seq1:69-1568(-)